MPTHGFSIKPLKVKRLAGEQKATEVWHLHILNKMAKMHRSGGTGKGGYRIYIYIHVSLTNSLVKSAGPLGSLFCSSQESPATGGFLLSLPFDSVEAAFKGSKRMPQSAGYQPRRLDRSGK